MAGKALQHARRFSAVAVAAFALAPLSSPAAGPVHVALAVSAEVSPSAVLRIEQRPTQIWVSEADIARGYVDLPAGSLLSLNAGSLKPLVVVDFSPSGSAFESVELRTQSVSGLAYGDPGHYVPVVAPSAVVNSLPPSGAVSASRLPALDLGSELKTIAAATDANRLPADLIAGTTMLVTYRFKLAEHVRPGSYPVPMTVNVGL